MKIIIDNGGTKLDWVVLGSDIIYTSNSINVFAPNDIILDQISNIFPVKIFKEKDIEIDFYTTGFNINTEKKIKHIFQTSFNLSSIHVFSDMLAASRALFNKKNGIVCIIGTGSNCAYFDGHDNHNTTLSLGHLLGDEGSAYHLSRTFLINYFKDNLSPDLKIKFENSMQMDQDKILSSIYMASDHKFYIASFSKFLKNNIEDPFIHQIIQDCFLQFFNNHPFKIPKFQTYRFGFVGSIAFHFQEIIATILDHRKIEYMILQKPIDNLIQYYN